MGNRGTCDLVPSADFVDLNDPTTVNTTDWISTTYDPVLKAHVVTIELEETSGVFLPPAAAGYWASVADYHAYVSELLGVPTDANGYLERFVVHQSGEAAMYFPDEDVLWQSPSFVYMLAAAANGLAYFDTVPDTAVFGKICSLPIRDAVDNEDDCVWQGGECLREITGTDGSASCTSSDKLVIWRANSTQFIGACAQHTLNKLSVDGGILVPFGTTLAETQQTNPIVCTSHGHLGPLNCDLSSFAELVRPVGYAPGQPGYNRRLVVRWIRVRADMSIDSEYWNSGAWEGRLNKEFLDTSAMQTNFNAETTLPLNATCSTNVAQNSAMGFEIPIDNGLAKDGSPNQPACIP